MAAAVIDAVVLAGGRSRRMGTDKARLPVGGRTLVDHAVARLAPLGGRVVVASGTAGRLGRPDEVADPAGVDGPVGGIVAGLAATDADVLAVVAVDQPATDPRVLRRLAEVCRRGDRAAAVPRVDGRLQPLHAVVARSAADAVRERVAAGERSPRRLFAALDAVVVDVDGWGDLDPSGAFSGDWDRPEDLPRSLRAALGGQASR